MLRINVVGNYSISILNVVALPFYHHTFSAPAFSIRTQVVGAVGLDTPVPRYIILAKKPIEFQWKFWLLHTTINNAVFWLAIGIIKHSHRYGYYQYITSWYMKAPSEGF